MKGTRIVTSLRQIDETSRTLGALARHGHLLHVQIHVRVRVHILVVTASFLEWRPLK